MYVRRHSGIRLECISSPLGLFPDLIDSCCDTKRSLDQQSQILACWDVFFIHPEFVTDNFSIIGRIDEENKMTDLQFSPSGH